jgi:hypothetical protein
MDPIIDDVVARTPGAIAQVGAELPRGFPEDVFEAVKTGLARLSAQIDQGRSS